MIDAGPQPLPSGSRGLDPEVVASSQRERLIDAMLWLCTDVGYENVTIAALTSRARTAKRTFYVHFEAREDCFLAAYDRIDVLAFEALLRGAGGESTPHRRIGAALGELLGFLAGDPLAAQLWVLDSRRGGGDRVGGRRLETMYRLADLYLALHAQIAETLDPPVPMTRVQALAIAGAIELPIVATLSESGPGALPSLREPLTTATYTLVYGSPPPA